MTKYLSVTETAVLIRQKLKNKFPSVKFSVRSSKYSGGASIDVSWLDGPREKLVKPIIDGFEGASFDGMNDLKSNQDSWLLPDGTAILASRPESYGGSVPGYVSDSPHPKAEMVSFGSDYVFCNRHISDCDNKIKQAVDYIRQHCTCEGTAPNDRFGNEWVYSLAGRMVSSISEGETIEIAFKRTIMREDI